MTYIIDSKSQCTKQTNFKMHKSMIHDSKTNKMKVFNFDHMIKVKIQEHFIVYQQFLIFSFLFLTYALSNLRDIKSSSKIISTFGNDSFRLFITLLAAGKTQDTQVKYGKFTFDRIENNIDYTSKRLLQ